MNKTHKKKERKNAPCPLNRILDPVRVVPDRTLHEPEQAYSVQIVRVSMQVAVKASKEKDALYISRRLALHEAIQRLALVVMGRKLVRDDFHLERAEAREDFDYCFVVLVSVLYCIEKRRNARKEKCWTGHSIDGTHGERIETQKRKERKG
jgi:hypothetical protein